MIASSVSRPRGALLALFALLAAQSPSVEAAGFDITLGTDRIDGLYASGETATVSVTAKGAVWAVLKEKTTGRKLVAFASHAWWRYDGAGDDWIRLNGAKMLAEKLRELAEKHDAAAVGGGDLNAPIESGSLKWLLSHGYADAQASAEVSPCGFPTEHGDPKRGPDGKYVGRNAANGHNLVPEKFRYLDHIFCDPTRVAARRFDIDISPEACKVSDHHPIVLDFNLKGARVEQL